MDVSKGPPDMDVETVRSTTGLSPLCSGPTAGASEEASSAKTLFPLFVAQELRQFVGRLIMDESGP